MEWYYEVLVVYGLLVSVERWDLYLLITWVYVVLSWQVRCEGVAYKPHYRGRSGRLWWPHLLMHVLVVNNQRSNVNTYVSCVPFTSHSQRSVTTDEPLWETAAEQYWACALISSSQLLLLWHATSLEIRGSVHYVEPYIAVWLHWSVTLELLIPTQLDCHFNVVSIVGTKLSIIQHSIKNSL